MVEGLTYIRTGEGSPMLHPLLLLAYVAGFVAFAVFYSREEGTRKAKTIAIVSVILAMLLSLFSLLIGGAVIVAATF
jgi:RsiW-degrading membrane proteinase PrsW (M82 family)